MRTYFADNTMILGSINDRQDMNVVATSTILRGLECLALRVLRYVMAPVAVVPVHAPCAARAAASCRGFKPMKHWQFGLSGMNPSIISLGTGLPVGSDLHQQVG